MYGIIPRAIRDLFEFVNRAVEQDGAQFQIQMNYFEIYKESLNNLLSKNRTSSENLTITNSEVLNAKPMIVYSPKEIFYYI